MYIAMNRFKVKKGSQYVLRAGLWPIARGT